MQEYVIHPLVVGANETDQGVMTYLKGYGKRIWIPIYVFYLEGGPEKILVDTGLEQFMVPPEVGEQYGLEIQEFEAALDTYGLKPEDIDIIIHTTCTTTTAKTTISAPTPGSMSRKRSTNFLKRPTR